MTDKPSLATQIGYLQSVIESTRRRTKGNSKDASFAALELRSLEATEAVLTYLINHEAEFKAFMAGRKGE